MSVKELVRSTTTTPGVGDFDSTAGTPIVVNRTLATAYVLDSTGTVKALNGGPWPTVAQGDIFYGSAASVISKLTKTATASFLDNSGTSNNPAWAAKAALTKTDDTNVTLALGGTPATSLLAATSLTLGWTGQLAVTRGGTGLANAATGDILYGSAADTLSRLAASTNGRVLTLASGIPSWAGELKPETYIELVEQGSPPSAPAANGVRIYAADAGGKTQLLALFASGAAQVLATEP